MKSLSILVLAGVLFASCNDAANNQHPSVKYEENKKSLGEMEGESPLKFLKVKGDFHGNLVNQTVVEGTITNHATLTGYKNMQLLIVFKDKEGAVIEKQKKVLDEVIDANSTQDFKVKTGHVKGVNSVSVDIISAVVDK